MIWAEASTSHLNDRPNGRESRCVCWIERDDTYQLIVRSAGWEGNGKGLTKDQRHVQVLTITYLGSLSACMYVCLYV